MINGDGLQDAVSSPASPDPLDLFSSKLSDGGDPSPGSLSRYSSCGGESEFDRYCSANSVMGTPSICSSSFGPVNDCLEFEFGSLRSLDGSLENFSLDGRFDRKLEDRKLSASGLDCSRESIKEHDNRLDSELDIRQESVNGIGNAIGEGSSSFVADKGDLEIGSDGTGSRYGYSEDDDSMYGCDSDDENRKNLYMHKNIHQINEAKAENGNPLLMSSSVAFGAEDWDDFEQETLQGNFAAMTVDNFQGQNGKELETQPAAGLSDIEDDIITEPSGFMGNNVLMENFGTASMVSGDAQDVRLKQPENGRDISIYNLVQDGIRISENTDVLEIEKDLFVKNSVDTKPFNYDKIIENEERGGAEYKLDPLSDTTNEFCSSPAECIGNGSSQFSRDHKPNTTALMIKNCRNNMLSSATIDASEDHLDPVKDDKVEHNEYYDEIVNEMEEILLDSSESPGARFPQVNLMSQSQQRDGGSTASTSGADIAFPITTQPPKIDGIEVIGAKQKKGDISLGERLVGVKEYTVYRIRVWSGNDQWEVERRYRDFFTLYRRLKSLFTDQGWNLPLPWYSVEKESRKIFGNASPDVVSERSVLIQECLSSVIHSGQFSSIPTALVWFLCPKDSNHSSPVETENVSMLGKTISLVVEIRAYKSTKQLLEGQHYTCAGCHKHFDGGMTLVRDFVQALGWGKPRLCEYTGQLFCSSCHTNDSAVLPARVLHYWDFSLYPVSQLAKSYLDSIHEQPMLCVSAVNPFLFSKVPALQHIMSIRKKIGIMLPYVRCPFRRTVNKGLGQRRYLLESNDFFALRDLIDLSKGAFAALPVMVETVSRKILEHITDQCLICCDVGIMCSARQSCNDPLSLIFPFQEGEVEKCSTCGSVFHKPCFKKLTNCPPCGAIIGNDKKPGGHNKLSRKASNLLGKSGSGLSVGLLTGLFSRANPEKTKYQKDNDTVILMGSLPSTHL